MSDVELEKIRYPTGRFARDVEATPGKRSGWIGRIAGLPAEVSAAVEGLEDSQLDTPIREGGWCPRQIVHHLADEHLNAFAYFKMALTEEDPAIRKYSEPRWAETPDARRAPPALSLTLLTGLHARWALLLRSLAPDAFGRAYIHPSRGRVSLDEGLQLYAWHGGHHTAQILGLRERRGW